MYPDLFENPSQTEEKKNKIDTDWKKYILYPDHMKARTMHSWGGEPDDQYERIPLMEHLLDNMLNEYKSGKIVEFMKFAGCLSHLFGDTTQPAHISPDSNLKFLSEMLPCPSLPEFANFHYHTSIEAVTGKCAPLHKPELLGTSVSEVAWVLAKHCQKAVIYCRRFIVPIIEALFDNDLTAAEDASTEPVTIAAQLTADSIYSIMRIADKSYSPKEYDSVNKIDLRLFDADESFHDLVYSGPILDGNKDVPPYTVPITPAKLKFFDGTKKVKGLGVLPHSGMSGLRECWMTWFLPKDVFMRFSAFVGLHTDLAVGGSASFHVLLNGKEVWSSGRMQKDDFAKKIDIDISKAKSLTLKVCDGNEGKSFWKNHCIWANPVILKSDFS